MSDASTATDGPVSPMAAPLERPRRWGPEPRENLELSRLMVARAEAMVERLRSRTDEGEALRRLPDVTLQEAIEAEFFKMRSPRERGGFQLGFDVLADVMRTLARGDVSAAWVIGFLALHVGFLSRFPKAGQDEAFDGHSFALAACPLRPCPGSRAVPGGFRVSGRWEFATGIRHATWVMVSPLVETENGKVHHQALVPVSEVTVVDTWHTHGARGTGSDDVVLDDVFVPHSRMIPAKQLWGANPPGAAAFPSYRDLAYEVRFAPPVSLAALAVGGAEGGLEIYRENVRKRVLFGSNAAAIDIPHIKSRYMHAATLVRMAGQLIDDQLAEYRFILENSGELSLQARGRRAAEGAMCAVLARDAVVELMDVAGAGSYRLSNKLQQVRRDVDMTKSHLMSDWDAMAEIGGHLALGLEPRAGDQLFLLT